MADGLTLSKTSREPGMSSLGAALRGEAGRSLCGEGGERRGEGGDSVKRVRRPRIIALKSEEARARRLK